MMASTDKERLELMVRVLTEEPEEWVVVETWRYTDRSQHTFVSSRMTRENADNLAKHDQYMPYEYTPDDRFHSPNRRIRAYVRKASPTEMRQPSYYQRLATLKGA